MKTEIITTTRQDFNGNRYYRSKGKRYFQRLISRHESELLHRAVWEFHNGAIPTKMHVHHKDHDTSNNSIENLQLMDAAEHLRSHMTPERRAWCAKNVVETAAPAAKAWHKGVAGKAWHSAHAKAQMKRRLAVVRIGLCQECGKEFRARCVQPQKYCSEKCNWRAQGRRKRARLKASRISAGK